MKRIPLLIPITLLGALLALFLAACSQDPWVVPVPPQPVPPQPVPPQPVPPTPPPVPPTPPPQPTAVASAENVARIIIGMTQNEVGSALGVQPSFSSHQDDGTWLADYPAVDEAGKPVYLSVHFSARGVVMGRSRIPRAVPPEPVASLPDGEIEDCTGGACAWKPCR